MPIYFSTLRRDTSARTDILDVTDDVARCVTESGIQNGVVTVGVAGSTASITTIEYESGAVEDLRQAIERVAPQGIAYRHDARWGDGNGYSHVRAALLGPSVCVPVRNGHPMLGTWQQLVLCDFDNRGRQRDIYVQVLGDL